MKNTAINAMKDAKDTAPANASENDEDGRESDSAPQRGNPQGQKTLLLGLDMVFRRSVDSMSPRLTALCWAGFVFLSRGGSLLQDWFGCPELIE